MMFCQGVKTIPSKLFPLSKTVTTTSRHEPQLLQHKMPSKAVHDRRQYPVSAALHTTAAKCQQVSCDKIIPLPFVKRSIMNSRLSASDAGFKQFTAYQRNIFRYNYCNFLVLLTLIPIIADCYNCFDQLLCKCTPS